MLGTFQNGGLSLYQPVKIPPPSPPPKKKQFHSVILAKNLFLD